MRHCRAGHCIATKALADRLGHKGSTKARAQQASMRQAEAQGTAAHKVEGRSRARHDRHGHRKTRAHQS